MTEPRADFMLRNRGGLVGFCAMSLAAEQWLVDNILLAEPAPDSELVLWVEHRLSRDLMNAITSDGLMVE